MHENVFGYNRRDSITEILLITGLPSFTTILHNAKQNRFLSNVFYVQFNIIVLQSASWVCWLYVTFIS